MGFYFEPVLLSLGHCDWDEGLYFFESSFSLCQLFVSTQRFGLIFLLDDNGSLEHERLSGIFRLGRFGVEGSYLNLNGGTVMFANFGRLLLGKVLLLGSGDFELTVVGLEGVHDFRCLFAE